MKIRSFILAAAVAMAAVSCGTPAETEIKGKFGEEAPEKVTVRVGQTDTTVVVENGTFTIAVPTDKCVAGSVLLAGSRSGAMFIPDGTEITADFTGEKPVAVPANSKSLTGKLNEAMDYLRSFYKVHNEKLSEMEQAGATEEQMDAYVDSVSLDRTNFLKALYNENKDNYLGFMAVNYLLNDDGCEPAEVKGMIEGMSEELRNTESVTRISRQLEVMDSTAEGKMFTDFTVSSVVGMTRSIPPQLKYGDVKFSDYVGKGKYMLVDFWASWCGPCKAEVPNLKAIYDKYNGEDFDILSVAVWDKAEASLKAAEDLGMNWNHIVNAQSIPTDLYGIQGIPHIILFGPDGTILKRGLRGEAIGEELAKYLGR